MIKKYEAICDKYIELAGLAGFEKKYPPNFPAANASA